ncbi:pimeloyl-ACP methyl ester carboxylesterase [Bacillus sp. SORGH_AS 510]|uniref:alpha/beta fold hydrolase n=1 Tax=Bacillus sp. SORGH_AS_0510 TaxID=3041771 RepID=UPI00278B453A|nr:alpha/beta hydrolase [Bacillus sp. SORGH_AS_0510]MDQ1144091.1 pimeloyl-ACP methyl ester carboxylesterase [Bacillus sp. SORGH_AS_0510]
MPKCLVGDIAMNYEIFGEGKPVVLIHGFGPDSRLMIGCMEPIFTKREGYKRIYIDLPGMGHTKGHESIQCSDDMLDVVIQFIDTIIPNQNFLLAGQSYGGYISRGVIAKRKKMVDGVAFICPMIVPEMENRTLPEHVVLFEDKEFLGQLSKEDKDDFCAINVVLDENKWKRYKKEVSSGCAIADEKFLAVIKKNYGFTFNVDCISFNHPSVFLLGKQDSVVGYQDAFKLLDNYPRATFAVLDQAGHNLHIEQEALFNSHINEWLDRID